MVCTHVYSTEIRPLMHRELEDKCSEAIQAHDQSLCYTQSESYANFLSDFSSSMNYKSIRNSWYVSLCEDVHYGIFSQSQRLQMTELVKCLS